MLKVEYEDGVKEIIMYPDPIVRVLNDEKSWLRKPEDTQDRCGESGDTQDANVGVPITPDTLKILCAAGESDSDDDLSLKELQTKKLFNADNEGLRHHSQPLHQARTNIGKKQCELHHAQAQGEAARGSRGHHEDQAIHVPKRHSAGATGMRSCSEHTCPNCDRLFPTLAAVSGHKRYCKARGLHIRGLAPEPKEALFILTVTLRPCCRTRATSCC